MRGFLVRQKFAERSHYLRTWLPAIIKIQVAAAGLGSPAWAHLGFGVSFPCAEWKGDSLLASEQEG